MYGRLAVSLLLLALPATAAASPTITEYPVPTANSQPTGITSNTGDGNLWFTEAAAGKIGRITLDGTATDWSVPTANSQPTAIAGNVSYAQVVFTEAAASKTAVGNVPSGSTGTSPGITETATPTPNSNPQGIVGETESPNGQTWFTETATNNIVGTLFTGTGGSSPTVFPVPTAGAEPTGLAAGPSASGLWFTETARNQIGFLPVSEETETTNAGDVEIQEYPLPTGNAQPLGIAAGPDSNMWFTEAAGNQIGRITKAGVVTEFPLPTANAQPTAIVGSDADDALWFTEPAANQIGRITTDGVITEFPVPTTNAQPFGIAFSQPGSDPFVSQSGPPAVWFTERAGNQIGTATIGPNAFVALPSRVGASSALLAGQVVPNGQQTSYRFQYGRTTGYGSQTPAQTVTSSAVTVGPSDPRVPVSTAITGLRPNTTYHYRLVATNASALTTTGDCTLTTGNGRTPPPAALEEDCLLIGASAPPRISYAAALSTGIRVTVRAPQAGSGIGIVAFAGNRSISGFGDAAAAPPGATLVPVKFGQDEGLSSVITRARTAKQPLNIVLDVTVSAGQFDGDATASLPVTLLP